VDRRLGGPEGLARARSELAKRNLRLILDFVPNHVAPDHPWVREHPAYFIHGNADDVRRDKSSFVDMHGSIYACGRDPYFPPWPDVLQLNAFDPWLRSAARATVADIASQCDGIRCDMAMLLLNDVFERTWGARAGARPAAEYWDEVIPFVKHTYPNLLLIAEAYWDLEWTLQQHGFDLCYDKRLYDRLEHGDAASVDLHLRADLAYQSRLLRFVENHDEPRAAAAFRGPKARAAAVVSSTLPGARLFHDGQFEGRTVRVPVFLSRRPKEGADPETQGFYARLLAAATSPTLRDGRWALLAHSGWTDNDSHRHLVAWRWTSDERHYVIVANLSDHPAQGRICLDWNNLSKHEWVLADILCDRVYRRSGAELARDGLFVDLAAWNCHLFECQKGTLS
jgi:glycosidase